MTFYFEKQLIKRQEAGNLRCLQMAQQLIDFSSNDYLGLARSSYLAALVMQEWSRHASSIHGLGSTGSRLLTGNSQYAQDLEDNIATFHGYEAGILFNCGYMANMALLSTIASSEDVIFFDIGVHASTYDGIRLSGAGSFSFKHNDLKHLEYRLKNCLVKGNRFICIESIYSTDGSIAPLVAMSQLAEEYEAFLIVDEAHAVGVSGPDGRGLIAQYALMEHVFAQVITFGKALGTHGAMILGKNKLKHALINFATPYIYTTALPFYSLAAIKCSYQLFPQLKEERDHLQKLIQFFQKSYASVSSTHIQSILIRGNKEVKYASQKLIDQGLDVRPLLSPTVQRGHEVLRICLHAFNTESQLENLLNHLKFDRKLCYA